MTECKCAHDANEASARAAEAYVRDFEDVQRHRAVVNESVEWQKSPAYWRLVWAGQIAAGQYAAYELSPENIAKLASEQADALVAEMFGEGE